MPTAPTDDYYDYQPLAQLSRHLILAGYVADETRRIGFQLAAMTGLGVRDIDRTIEHHRGQSVWELTALEGEAAYRAAEQDALGSLLRSTPNCIVALSDGTLLDPDNRQLIASRGDLVLLDRDLGHCYWRLQRQAAENEAGWHPLALEPLTTLNQIKGYFQERKRSFAGIDQRVDLRGRSRHEVVRSLFALLDPSP